MKTIIIYNEIELPIKFSIVEGDFSRFNGVCFNAGIPHEHEMECSDFIFDEEGNYRINFDSDTKILESKDWDKVAMITFLP